MSMKYLNKILSAESVKTKARGGAISVKKYPSEQISIAPKTGAGLPHHLQPGMVYPEDMVVIVMSSKEETVKTHLGKEGGLCGGVAEWVYMPGYSGTSIRAKVLFNELET